MACKKVSGKELANYLRSGMDCAFLTEKYDLSVPQLKATLKKMVARGILSQNELPAWLSDERLWKCPKCGKGQAERFPACPICGVIISKFTKLNIESEASQIPGSPNTPDSPPSFDPRIVLHKLWGTRGLPVIICLLFLLLVGAIIVLIPGNPVQPIKPQTEQLSTARNELASSDTSQSNQRFGLRNTEIELKGKAPAKLKKIEVLEQLARDYHAKHTYSMLDQFACVDMSIDLWNQIETAGIRAGLMAGNIEKNIADVRYENWIKYVREMNHAWVVAEIKPGTWIPVESTAGLVVNPMAPNYALYFTGEFFNTPREFKRFEELRRNTARRCQEAQEMDNILRDFVKHQRRSWEGLLEAYRATGMVDQKIDDCLSHAKEIFHILKNQQSCPAPWSIQ